MKLTYKTDTGNKTVEMTFLEPYSDTMLHIETKDDFLIMPTKDIVSITN